jgi:catechol 2,3-dioxygenase-like lactoylglutathione lyase family enzyme
MQYTIELPAVAGDASADFFPIARAPGEPYLRVHGVTVFVRDQERSRDFYLNTLGFSLVVDTQFEEFRWLAVAPPDGHTVLALLAPKPCADQGTLPCTVIGLFEEWKCDIAECELRTGDTLTIYTDGITESFSEMGEEFGEERLTQSLRRYRQLRSHELLASIVDDVRRFSAPEQFDDITLTVGTCRL